MNTIWLLKVTSCDNGEDVYTIAEGVYSSEECAIHELAEWCKGQWAYQQQNEIVDDDAENLLDGTDTEIVQKYFAFWTPEEEYSLGVMEVDKEL